MSDSLLSTETFLMEEKTRMKEHLKERLRLLQLHIVANLHMRIFGSTTCRTLMQKITIQVHYCQQGTGVTGHGVFKIRQAEFCLLEFPLVPQSFAV